MSTRHLLNNAQNGSFEAAVQVFLNFSNGTQDFEKSEEHARQAFEIAKKILESSFYLNELNISNFKRILELKINLHQNLTVFIGENGVGKTSLLNAIQKNLSWFTAAILKENTNGERIVDKEINNQAKMNGYVSYLNCVFKIGSDYGIHGQLVREPRGITSDLKTDVMEYRKFGRNIRDLIAFGKVDLPLFVFYDIERFKLNPNSKEVDTAGGIFYQLDGYDRSSKSKVTVEIFIDWLIKLLKTSNVVINTPERLKIKSQVDNLIKAGANNKENSLNELYEDLVLTLKLYPDDEAKSESKKTIKILEKLFRRIYPNLIQIQLINDDDGVDKVTIQLDNEIILFNQFSDGQRVLFGLLGDIARRLILLNSFEDNPLKGRGIVLIDEIELHLHPSWQQKIILILRKSFPNIQFIITTHSPHVITTVEPECIRSIYIDPETNTYKYEVPHFTKGAESNVVLENVFYVDPRPQEVDEVGWLEEYTLLVNQDKWDSEEALSLRKKLDAWGKNKEPELDKLDIEISLKNFKRSKK
ncbi:AAA family ATPase [Acinetobacter guillouiae]|uniref:AAA family ATPase n=1 Tax=Acinetobacter guillouiae TaxID=106649 RepID=UPI003AF6D0BE